ncbi:MAG: hypothetical protein E5W49_23965, partial [Mesorhizobium sp.]
MSKIHSKVSKTFQRERAITMLKCLIMGAAAIAGAGSVPSQAFASEWGCQVLLCLSGDWQGTPSCHPPARYDPYEACPQGWMPYAPTSDRPGQGQASM